MRALRFLASSLLAALLWTAAVAPLLPSSGGGAMPCCQGGRPCDTALQATGCCRIDAVADRAVGLAAPVTRSAGCGKAFLSAEPALPAFAYAAPVPDRTAALWTDGSPPRASTAPLYLLNATLLC